MMLKLCIGYNTNTKSLAAMLPLMMSSVAITLQLVTLCIQPVIESQNILYTSRP